MAVFKLTQDIGALELMSLVNNSTVKNFYNSGSKIFMIEFENNLIISLVFEKNNQRFSIEGSDSLVSKLKSK
ncbi:MAG: hypothetical protein M1405_00480 [Patescibacteria group bacterium]|nr:hypothetical protein [Patescibacteria group bacterium]